MRFLFFINTEIEICISLVFIFVCCCRCFFQVAKQWHDFERQTFNYVKKLKEPGTSITFTHQSDFDDNGLVYWIGTNGK